MLVQRPQPPLERAPLSTVSQHHLEPSTVSTSDGPRTTSSGGSHTSHLHLHQASIIKSCARFAAHCTESSVRTPVRQCRIFDARQGGPVRPTSPPDTCSRCHKKHGSLGRSGAPTVPTLTLRCSPIERLKPATLRQLSGDSWASGSTRPGWRGRQRQGEASPSISRWTSMPFVPAPLGREPWPGTAWRSLDTLAFRWQSGRSTTASLVQGNSRFNTSLVSACSLRVERGTRPGVEWAASRR